MIKEAMLIGGLRRVVGTCGLSGRKMVCRHVARLIPNGYIPGQHHRMLHHRPLLPDCLRKARVMTPGENVLLITGFCGGFTTFSSFADDMWVLGSKGDWTTFILYLALSVILGVLLVWGGRALIR